MNDDHDPEKLAAAAAAVAEQGEMDRAHAQETGGKSLLQGMRYKGIWIESRYSVTAELQRMQRIVDELPQLTARRVESIWCDSKACACYVVEVRSGACAPVVSDDLRDAIMTAGGGHNGITIMEGETRLADIDPDWDEDFDAT